VFSPDNANRLARRQFSVLAVALALAPYAARAQRSVTPIIGFLDTAAAAPAKMSPFFDGLKLEGYVKNQNIALAYHSAESVYDRLPELAADLVSRNVNLIVAAGVPAVLAAKAATATIPIVFAINCDPARIGLVGSSHYTGDNITGAAILSAEQQNKRLQLLRAVLPAASRFALLVNPANPDAEAQKHDALQAAQNLGLVLEVLYARVEQDLDNAFTKLAALGVGGLAIGDDDFLSSHSSRLAALASSHALPAISPDRGFVTAGGLMSYGGNLIELYHQAGAYAGLVLKGGKAAELPIYKSANAQLVINRNSARLLGLTLPTLLLDRTHPVIE
jgi:ABC-type uncharacterized transport system substrate-binding protein